MRAIRSSAQLLPLATSYPPIAGSATCVDRARPSAAARADRPACPYRSAAVAKEQAELARLSAMNVGMGAQVFSARLAALAEGGDVRVIDEAVDSPTRHVSAAECRRSRMWSGWRCASSAWSLALLGVPVDGSAATISSHAPVGTRTRRTRRHRALASATLVAFRRERSADGARPSLSPTWLSASCGASAVCCRPRNERHDRRR